MIRPAFCGSRMVPQSHNSEPFTPLAKHSKSARYKGRERHTVPGCPVSKIGGIPGFLGVCACMHRMMSPDVSLKSVR